MGNLIIFEGIENFIRKKLKKYRNEKYDLK